MRNSDYTPTRLDAQQDAASLISNRKLRSNPESSCGVLSMAGKGVELLVSPTEDSQKVLASFAKMTIGGESTFCSAVRIAQLALKHRKNKNGAQRIIAFVGSPLQETVAQLTQVGKILKKNNVAVDVVSIGELEDNDEKLKAFVEAVNAQDNSNILVVPAGVSPMDAISSSPILSGDSMGGGAGGTENFGGGAVGGGFDLGFDESQDPELAAVLRMSAEEARDREQAANVETSNNNEGKEDAGTSSFGGAGATDEASEDEMLARAMALSMVSESGGNDKADAGEEEEEEDDSDDDEAMRAAMALSMGGMDTDTNVNPPPAPTSTGTTGEVDLSQQVREALGADADLMNDPIMQAAMAQLAESDKKKEGEDNKKRKNDE